MCRYVVYLEYLKSYYKIPSKLLDTENKNNESYTFSETIRKSMEINNKIQEEKNHSYKVFPVVFHAYSEYENNLPSHLFLELIREDYLVIRDKLQDALSPINQVGYKIMNAMQE
jgi:chromosome segregation ATPase